MIEPTTREGWIERIRAADSVAEVFDSANRALSNREAWGDDLTGAWAAAERWASFLFPIEAVDGLVQVGIFRPEGSDLLKVSLAAAKSVAVALLIPLPALGLGGLPLPEPERRFNWGEVSQAASVAAVSSMGDRLGASELAGLLFGPDAMMGSEAMDWERAQHATGWSGLRAMLLNPVPAHVERDCDKGGCAAEILAEWTAAAAESGAARKLMTEVAAGFVLAGPAGGLGVALKAASMLRAGFKAIAREVGVPIEAIGVGLEGLALNAWSPQAAAYYNPNIKTLAFGPAPSHVAHEWTHILDYRIEAVGAAEQRSALSELKRTARDLSPDQELAVELRGEILHDAAPYLRWLLKNANAPVSKDDVGVIDRAKAAAAKGEGPWREFLASQKGPSTSFFDERGVQEVLSRMRQGQGLDVEAEKISAFMREARLRDENDGGPQPYWASSKEMVARIGEARFVGAGSSSLAWRGKDALLPRGREDAELRRAYQKLIDTFAASPKTLANYRAASALDLADADCGHVKTPAVNLTGWRLKDQPVEALRAPSTRQGSCL